jgi:hypothetical protein
MSLITRTAGLGLCTEYDRERLLRLSGSGVRRAARPLDHGRTDLRPGAAHQVFDSRNYNELAKPFLGLEPAPD